MTDERDEEVERQRARDFDPRNAQTIRLSDLVPPDHPVDRVRPVTVNIGLDFEGGWDRARCLSGTVTGRRATVGRVNVPDGSFIRNAMGVLGPQIREMVAERPDAGVHVAVPDGLREQIMNRLAEAMARLSFIDASNALTAQEIGRIARSVRPAQTQKPLPKRPKTTGVRTVDLCDVDQTQFCVEGIHDYVMGRAKVGCDKDCVCKTAVRHCKTCGKPDADFAALHRDVVLSRCQETTKLIGGE